MKLHPARLVIAVSACTLLVPATGATAAKSKLATYPQVTKISPLALGIGDTLTITGKNFRSGKNKNTVVFKKDGGRAVFVRAPKASTTKITLTVPAKLLPFLRQKAGAPVATRFRIRVLARRFGKAFSAQSKSPLIAPRSLNVGTKDDCDGDKVKNKSDEDDDNDLLLDTLEADIGTNACARDSDEDGMSDGWEYQSALDRNNGRAAGAKPSPNRKPYANPLDKADGAVDQDGDGLTNDLEYSAWATFSNKFRSAPAGGSVLTYSGGNPASDGRGRPSADKLFADRDLNGFFSDFERDADGDNIPNLDEGGSKNVAGGVTPGDQPLDDLRFYDYGLFTEIYIEKAAEFTKQGGIQCAGINQVPFYCADSATPSIKVQKVDALDWLASDTDGDGIRDDVDDQDHDDIPNITEYLGELSAAPLDRHYAQLDACIPNSDSHFCLLGSVDVDRDGIDNRDDLDDDGDLLADTLEKNLKLNPLVADSDGDGVSDGFEYYSALDFNSANLPFPGKRPYPNALDGDDADKDFDQDVLTLREEYKAWIYTGKPFPLSYTDGTKYSGGKVAIGAGQANLDLDLNGFLSDDEKDVDSDGLTNFDETHGRMTQKWWVSAFKPAPFNESQYPGPEYLETSFVDPDTDGDTVKDGADDQDHDGFTNGFEVDRPFDWFNTYVSTIHSGTNDKARVQPFNPCKPWYSDSCHAHPPFAYYKDEEDWESPVHANGNE